MTLKVSAKSNPNAVAGALAAALRERETSELQAVGAGAINQAIKAVAIARSYLRGCASRPGLHAVVRRRRHRRERAYRDLAASSSVASWRRRFRNVEG